MSVIDELQKNVDSVRRELRNLAVMGMDPKQPADQLALIKQLEISARAEQRLRKMALDYAQDQVARGSSQVFPQGPHRKTPARGLASNS